MDTIHDLGGKQGFGPVDVNEPEVPFHHDWEARAWALARAGGRPGLTIDWWRHMVERMDPATYMTVPYFEKWCLTDLVGYIDTGYFTVGEAIEGHLLTTPKGTPPKGIGLPELMENMRLSVKDFEVPTDEPAKFSVGDQVRTISYAVPTHTRLPAYARGRIGEVISHHGAHPLPDKSAQGLEVAEHLYTVVFKATELWGEEADPRDTVTLDLWESYFE
ncbi:nitrile hydratase subunit beta [Cochlodiniinecator piscidefendens]|uniref:nitrile hydratase subunit beta n=1 Tax=Cochlodiniinecator piscidefendens TaxID=2715756 RepID=UPI00140CCA1D|nr:nitrile hydratase subunit beta [Cochlodiniinecator piscidefendens]